MLNPVKAAPPLRCSPQVYVIGISLHNMSFVSHIGIVACYLTINQVPAGVAALTPSCLVYPSSRLTVTKFFGKHSSLIVPVILQFLANGHLYQLFANKAVPKWLWWCLDCLSARHISR